MTDYYLRSTDGADSPGGTTWATAFATVVYALTQMASGDRIFVSQVHAEATAAPIIIVFNNTTAICVNDGAEPPTAVATTAVIATISTQAFSIKGTGYSYGITYESSRTFSMNDTLALLDLVFEQCKIYISRNAGDDISIGAASNFPGNRIEFRDTTVQLTHADSAIKVSGSGKLEWGGGAYTGVVPTSLFIMGSDGSHVKVLDVDLYSSQDWSGAPLVTVGTSSQEQNVDIQFQRCKLGANTALISGTIDESTMGIKMLSCDQADEKNRFEEQYYWGSIVSDTGVHRTPDFSAKMVSNTNSIEYQKPLRFILADFYSAANPTIRVETITDGVTLQNDEFWIEVESPDVTDEALGNIVDTRPATILTAPANNPTSTEAWTEALGTPTKQYVTKTISGGAAGRHTVWACLANATAAKTVYVDPLVTRS